MTNPISTAALAAMGVPAATLGDVWRAMRAADTSRKSHHYAILSEGARMTLYSHTLPLAHWACRITEEAALHRYRAERRGLIDIIRACDSRDRFSQSRREACIYACFLRRLAGL